MIEQPLRIGHIVEVRSTSVVGELEASVEDLYRTYQSRKYPIGQVGSIVKIESGDLLVFGIVTSLRMVETVEGVPISEKRTESVNVKWMDIELFGQGRRTGIEEGEFVFDRGISTYPMPGHPISIVTTDELFRIFSVPDAPNIVVGKLAQARSLPVHLLVNELLGKHFAILGTTGSGKSCCVALILQKIIEKCPNAHIILLDPQDEYASAFKERAKIIDPANFGIPFWMMNFDEMADLLIGKTEHAATNQISILRQAITEVRSQSMELLPELAEIEKVNGKIIVNVDTCIPFKISALKDILEREIGKFTTKTDKDPYEKIKNKLQRMVDDPRLSFMLKETGEVEDTLAVKIGELLRVPGENKPITIVKLNGVPSEVVNVIVSVICRCVFEIAFWNTKRGSIPMLIVCEEAHRYAPRGDESAFKGSKGSLSRIAKEGRKYGVGLGLVSQRPSELSETILSQCNTIIALRMNNEADQAYVKNTLPDNVKSLVDALPAFGKREALVVGEGTPVPAKIILDNLAKESCPEGSDIEIAEAWSANVATLGELQSIIHNWRKRSKDTTCEVALGNIVAEKLE